MPLHPDVPLAPTAVVKLGGSLLDLPDLVRRLDQLRPNWGVRPLLVVGGGAAADLVRDWDQKYHLGEERAHWLALDSLDMTARFIETLWPPARFSRLGEYAPSWVDSLVPVTRPREWFEAAQLSGETTPPHSWETTTDTIAAWVATLTQAESLWLLKSVPCPSSVAEGIRQESIDPQFAHWLPAGTPICWVNLREAGRRSWLVADG